MYAYECRNLYFQLVPETAWNKDIHKLIPNWNEITKHVRSCGRCVICREETDELNTHKEWLYDDTNHIQRIFRVAPVCKACYNAIHISRACTNGTLNTALEQYMKVNGVTIDEAYADIEEARQVWIERSTFEWRLDEEQIRKRITEQTGISCDLDEPVNGRYYADVSYLDKDFAKQLGARWDAERNLWYFSSETERRRWLDSRIMRRKAKS